MATGEDEAQPIVGDFAVIESWFVDDLTRKELRMRFDFFFETRLSPETIDGFVFGCLNDPGARRVGHAFSAPLVDRGGERFLRGVFRQFEIAEMTDESGHNAAPVGPVDLIDRNVRVGKHV